MENNNIPSSEKEREKLGSRLGFILISAGCAIGIGNVWKFPYITGQNGGGAFVVVYLFFLAILGIPILTMEFSLGRAAKKSPVKMYDVLAPDKPKWRVHGYASLVGNYLLMMFYTTVAGWMLRYFISMASGKFVGMDQVAVETEFSAMLGDAVSSLVYTAIEVVQYTTLDRLLKIYLILAISCLLTSERTAKAKANT